MPAIRLAASVLVNLFLVALCAVLLPSAFELQAAAPQGGLGAGALPQFVVVVVPILAVAILISDIVAHRKAARRLTPPQDGEVDLVGADPRRVLTIGATVLVLLAAYAAAWRFFGFPIASIAFMAALALLIVPREHRTPGGLAIIAATTLGFCLGTWAFFVHVLAVPLR